MSSRCFDQRVRVFGLANRRREGQIIATPRYAAPGCVGILYQSAVVVRADDPATSLADMRGRRCVVNELDSNSGMNLLRAALGAVFADPRLAPVRRRLLLDGIDFAPVSTPAIELRRRADGGTLASNLTSRSSSS